MLVWILHFLCQLSQVLGLRILYLLGSSWLPLENAREMTLFGMEALGDQPCLLIRSSVAHLVCEMEQLKSRRMRILMLQPCRKWGRGEET